MIFLISIASKLKLTISLKVDPARAFNNSNTAG
jgi:hypothetical protein